MNKRHGLWAIALIAAAGCNNASTPGGPGVANNDRSAKTTDPTTPPVVNRETSARPASDSTVTNRPNYGEAERTFEVSTPVLSTRVVQGETKAIAIGISRGKNFDEDVTLRLTEIPKGVTFDPPAPRIMHGDKDCKVNVQVAEDAALGDFTVNVSGHPEKGADATTTLKLTVVEK
jgi:hypothetical protein